MADGNTFEKSEITNINILKHNEEACNRERVLVKVRKHDGNLKHRFRTTVWKLMRIEKETIDFGQNGERGLVIHPGDCMITPQKEPNYLFVEKVIDEFDSSIIDEMIDSVEQNISKKQMKRDSNSLMSDVNSSSL